MSEPQLTRCGALAAIIVVTCVGVARADGGRLCATERAGPWQVSVFVSPAFPVTGPVDISVYLQSIEGGDAPPDVTVVVEARHADGPLIVRQAATEAAATNKLFRSAICDLPEPGAWKFYVTIVEPAGHKHVVSVDLEVATGDEIAAGLALWFTWPAAPVALFAFHLWLVHRKRNTSKTRPA